MRASTALKTLAATSLAMGVAAWVTSGSALRAAGNAGAAGPATGITAVDGIAVGHVTLTERPTGCTVILADGEGAVAGISQRGAAPGTRETDLLNPSHMVQRVHAITLAGGSAFGLDAATGVMRWLEEHQRGFQAGASRVPIVPAAVIFDLPVGGKPTIRPTADCGYRAAAAANTGAVAEGSVGAGAGATVGKLGGFAAPGQVLPMKGGVGTAAITLPNGLVVGALAVVNAVGDIVDPATGKVVAGGRRKDGSLADARTLLRAGGTLPAKPAENTTLVVVATNATLTKPQASRVALMADDGLARAIYPSHTSSDGDTVFALATGRFKGAADVDTIGGLAADAVAQAIVRAVREATGLPGIPAVRDLVR